MNFQQSFLSNDPNKNFIDYRCIDPLATVMDSPWFPMRDVCPCDPKTANPTGRGYTSCPYGISFDDKPTNTIPLQTIKDVETQWLPENVTKLPKGSMFPKNSYTAPQLQPRQLNRIGVTWRQ
jgi:hypothetical protein